MVIFSLNILHKKGWNNLQERYRCNSYTINGKTIRIKSLSIDGISSQNVVRIKVSNQGLYLRCISPFDIFSKPLLIPWTEITDIQNKKAFIGSYKRLVIGNPFASTIDFAERDFNKIRSYLP